ncbi:cation:proton antiporter [Pseudoalteromonas sp. C2R02]|uniref:cation:proton antiporter n=1 Tax=Pseudoalteromonas sp. C2R02 TaxID=2841565 RepID=UPI001C09E54F|nr:cation:proton antiporter [Pseudoalteromonas sp. C2R02]MBU2970550.1 cation:proton antiporter [Pseudoalteromonas sp. C2R02]
MHDHHALILTSVLIFIFGLVSKLSARSIFTAPMFFVAVGIMISSFGLGLFHIKADTQMVKFLAELTLIIILFVDGSLLKLTHLKDALSGISGRLLLIGLPLTAILGSLFGILIFPEWGVWSILLLALILSPTDAALGQAVVKSEVVPDEIKQGISIESGLNDGMVLPPILICIAALAQGGTALPNDQNWLQYIILQLTLGPIFGVIIGHFGGKAIDFACSNNWMESTFQRLSCLSLAILAFSFAEAVQGNGFIAAFVAGLTLSVNNRIVRDRIQEFGEAEGQLLSLFIFLIFGLVAVPAFISYWDLSSIVYAILSLTVIRMLPVAICLMGFKVNMYSKLFIGWFGPRGIASILYLLIVIGDIGTEGHEDVLSVIVLTVLISIFAHGISALPMTNKFR